MAKTKKIIVNDTEISVLLDNTEADDQPLKTRLLYFDLISLCMKK